MGAEVTRALLVLALALLAACALPAASSAATETASSGQITAHFNYEGSQSKGYSNLALTINRAGATAYDAPVNTSLCGNMCWPAGSGQTPSVAVRDLDGDGDPEVLLDLYSGGAHCCFVSDLLGWDPDSGIYRVVE